MPREAGAGDRSGGVRRVAERKTHLEAEEASEGGGGVGSRGGVRDGKAWRKGVPLTLPTSPAVIPPTLYSSARPLTRRFDPFRRRTFDFMIQHDQGRSVFQLGGDDTHLAFLRPENAI